MKKTIKQMYKQIPKAIKRGVQVAAVVSALAFSHTQVYKKGYSDNNADQMKAQLTQMDQDYKMAETLMELGRKHKDYSKRKVLHNEARTYLSSVIKDTREFQKEWGTPFMEAVKCDEQYGEKWKLFEKSLMHNPQYITRAEELANKSGVNVLINVPNGIRNGILEVMRDAKQTRDEIEDKSYSRVARKKLKSAGSKGDAALIEALSDLVDDKHAENVLRQKQLQHRQHRSDEEYNQITEILKDLVKQQLSDLEQQNRDLYGDTHPEENESKSNSWFDMEREKGQKNEIRQK